jgi:hypothetical protein
MVRRLILGLVFGLIVGVALAAGLVRLGEVSFAGGAGLLFAYLAAAAVGALTGMVAGKPIWASGAKVEGGLKALFGGLMGAGAMFALRQWATGVEVNMSFLGGGGPAAIGDLPAASLPLIAAVLGGLFGLDNTAADEEGDGPKGRKRVADGGAGGPRVAARSPVKSLGSGEGSGEDAGEEAPIVPKRAKR